MAGSEQGAPVAALTKNQVDKLREIMWAMNAVDYSTRAETAVIETTDKNGKVTTTEITETVLVISLTHKTPDEMAADYHFTTIVGGNVLAVVLYGIGDFFQPVAVFCRQGFYGFLHCDSIFIGRICGKKDAIGRAGHKRHKADYDNNTKRHADACGDGYN